MKPAVSIRGLCVVLALPPMLLAGCGDDERTEDTSAKDTPTPSTAFMDPAASAERVVDDFKASLCGLAGGSPGAGIVTCQGADQTEFALIHVYESPTQLDLAVSAAECQAGKTYVRGPSWYAETHSAAFAEQFVVAGAKPVSCG